MKKRRIVILGDSHTDAFKRFLKRNRSVFGEQFTIEAYRYTQIKNDKQIGDLTTEQIEELLFTLSADDLVISTIGGNQHQVMSLVQHPIPFDIFVPNSNAQTVQFNVVIPYNQFWDVFESGLRGRDGQRLQHLRKHSQSQIIHLAPPPPKEDEAHILKRHETAFIQAGITDKGVSPASLRLKIWQLQINVLDKLTKEYDVKFFLPPKETLSSNGYLDPLYYAEDATHANIDYAELVLKQTIDYCATI